MKYAAAKYKLLRRIDREQTALEMAGVRAGLRFGIVARQRAYAAWNTTRDIDAVRRAIKHVLLGNDKLELPGIVATVRDAMVAAHLTGVKRTGLNLKDHVDAGVQLSTAFDGAIQFLRTRLSMSQSDLETLAEHYESAALQVVQESERSLEQAVQRSIISSTEAGEGVRGGIKALRKAFESEGYSAGADHHLEAIFRTQTQTAYHAGRWQSLTDPVLQDTIWGFEYASVMDDRVTLDICRPLNGMTLPKEHEAWTRLWPPNHWNCRSTPLELLEQTRITDVPNVSPQEGFGFNSGLIFATAA